MWAVCRQCDGTGLAFSGPQGCSCAFGLIHIAPAVQRVLYVTRRGEVEMEHGHWSSYNDRTYYAFLHPEEDVKRVSVAAPDSDQAKRVVVTDPLDLRDESVAL